MNIFTYYDESIAPKSDYLEPVFDSNKLKSIAQKERWKDADLRKRMSIAHTGLKHTQETKDKIGSVHRGKKVSQETRAKLSKMAKQRDKKYAYHTPAGIFYTAEEAAKHYGLSSDGLIYRCLSKSKKNEKFFREKLDK